MNMNDPRRTEENREDASEMQAPWQFPPANQGALGPTANQEFPMAQFNFYPPPPRAPHHPSTTGSYHGTHPQNAAYSSGGQSYFMPPYHSQFSPFQYGAPPYSMAVPPYNMEAVVTQQSSVPTFRQIAPKPPNQNPAVPNRSSGTKPPDFIETVKEIRKDLYSRGHVTEDKDPPVLDSKEHSNWRKSVMDRWKPVSTRTPVQSDFFHYLLSFLLCAFIDSPVDC